MQLSKKQKRSQKLKKVKKAKAAAKHEKNRAEKVKAFETFERSQMYNPMFGIDPSAIKTGKEVSKRPQPDYSKMVSDFGGSMEQWYQIVLNTHNEFNYGFQYEDLEEVLLNRH